MYASYSYLCSLCVRSTNYATLVTTQLIVVATHMVQITLIWKRESCSTRFLCHTSVAFGMIITLLNIGFSSLVFLKAGLGLHDTDAWYMIETIAGKNNIGYKHIVSYIRLFLMPPILLSPFCCNVVEAFL